MRKLLSLLGAISIVATSSATVVACGNKVDPIIEPGVNYDEIINNLKIEVDEIFWKHLNENVYKNLIGLPDTEGQFYFLTRNKIIENSGKNSDELDPFELEQLEKDIKRVLEYDQLSTDLNKLKSVNEYKIILNDVDSLLKNIIFDWKSLVIKSYVSENSDKLYLGNVIVDYKIQIQYKGEKDIETFDISENFKFTSTNSDSLKKASDDFYKNIAKDYFSSTDLEDRKHTNLNWEELRDTKKSYEGFGRVDKEFKEYYQDNSKDNGFESSIVNFIKKNYFEKVGNTLPLSFEGDLIYKSSEMDKYSLFKTVNQYRKYDDEKNIKFDYNSDSGRIFLNTIFRNDPNNSSTKNTLLSQYFTTSNYSIWKNDFETKKDSFIKELKLEENQIKETNEYKSSAALGYINLTGLSINLSNGMYIHELPDFKLAVNYFVNINQSDNQILSNMSEFSVETLKEWHKIFGVSHNYKYPEYNSKEDLLMTLNSSKLTEEITEKFTLQVWNQNSTSFFNDAFTLRGRPYLAETKINLLNNANLSENSLYNMSISDLETNYHGWTYSTFNWSANKKTGINIKANGKSELRNNKVMNFTFGYFNFHIDLDQITMGAMELEDKEIVKFI
ncbi:lipoprotein [Spiroplasma endosymbiont of Dioctria linearis]|uniref:lipoprotein n=1 Tax=Spiroplasma endosymbiont of Dioctria linearis TaxID=3066290 RepID=UPI00313AF98C